MDDNTISFTIKIDYEKYKYELHKYDIITYEELKDECLNYFKIDKKEEKFMVFTYIDNEGDTNILNSENNEIFEAAKEIENGNYFLNLNLNIKHYNIINELEEEKEEKESIKNDDLNKSIKEEKNNDKEIEKVKNEFNYKLKLINIFYKKQIKSIHEEVINIINKKSKYIEEQMNKLGLNIDNNINDINKEENISLIINNKKEENNIININKNKLLKNENEKNNEIIEQSFISYGSKIDIITNNKDDTIKTYNIINKYNILEEDEQKDDYKNIEKENDKIRKSYFGKYFPNFGFKNQNNEMEKKLNEIKDIIKSLKNNKKPLKKDDYVNKGKDIFKKMQIHNINKNHIVGYFDNYLFEKNVEKKLDEKIKYYFILKNISNIIVTENICKILYDFFKEEKYDKTINIKNEKDLRNILRNLNEDNIKYSSNLMKTLDNNLNINQL